MWNNHWAQLWPSRTAPSPLPTPIHPLTPRSQSSGCATPPGRASGASRFPCKEKLPSRPTSGFPSPSSLLVGSGKGGQGTQEHTKALSPNTLNQNRQQQEAVRGEGLSQSKRNERSQPKAWLDGPRVLDTGEGTPGALRTLWALEQQKGLPSSPSGGDNG